MNRTAIILLTLAGLVLAGVLVRGQEPDITPGSIVTDPLDISALQSPTDQPVYGVLYIYQPWILCPGEYEVIGVSFDLTNWVMADEFPARYVVAVPITSSNQTTFYRVGNQIRL